MTSVKFPGRAGAFIRVHPSPIISGTFEELHPSKPSTRLVLVTLQGQEGTLYVRILNCLLVLLGKFFTFIGACAVSVSVIRLVTVRTLHLSSVQR